MTSVASWVPTTGVSRRRHGLLEHGGGAGRVGKRCPEVKTSRLHSGACSILRAIAGSTVVVDFDKSPQAPMSMRQPSQLQSRITVEAHAGFTGA